MLPKPWAWKVCAALAVSAVLWLAWQWGQASIHRHSEAQGAPDQGKPTPLPTGPADIGAPRFETGLEALPPSLRGAEPPAGLIIDEAGRLVVRRSLRDFFDYFLSALGEEPLSTLRARLKAYIGKSLPGPAAAEATRILDGYLGYRLALTSVNQAGGKPVEQLDLAAVVAQKQRERALRAQYLSVPVATAFFGDDDRYDDYTLSRLQVEGDQSLSPSEKNARLDALFAQLPADTQAQIRSVQTLQELEQVDARCQQQACSAGQLYQQRAALLGDEVAVRLQALDGQRALWSARVEAYLNQRALILGDSALSDQQRQVQLLRLRQSGFTPEEQLRLTTFEHAHAHATGL